MAIEFVSGQRNAKEKDILLSLSNDIASVKNKNDILRIIHPKLKLLFSTEDIFICFLNVVNNELEPIMRVGGANRMKHPDYEKTVNCSFPIHDDFTGKVLKAREPIVFDIDELNQLKNPTNSMKLYKATGLAEVLSVSLYNAGEVIGIITLFSEIKNFFTKYHKDLISEIANYLSIVVVNIRASEQIAKSEDFKTMLLSLSNEIAAVRSKNDLLHVLNIKLKELFPIIGFGITLLNEDGKTHSPFVVDSDDYIRDDVDFEKVIALKYSIEDGVYNSIVSENEPVVLNVDEIVPMIETAAYVVFWKKMNVKTVVGFSLRTAGKNMGCLILLLENNTHSKISNDLMKGVCATVSIAIANIKANEEIVSREEEKGLLLSLSGEIAALRNRNDLLQIVNTRLKQLFSSKEFGIAQINKDPETYSAFVLDLTEEVKSHGDFKKVTSDKYLVTDPVFSRVIKSSEPVLFNVRQLAEEPGIPAYVHFWKDIGLSYVLCTALRSGGKEIGCVFLHIDPSVTREINSTLLKAVCAHLSVAVSNVLANEEIANREVEKTILLSLSGEIASLKNKDDLFDVVNSRIKKLFSITEFGIARINEDGVTHSAFMMDLGNPVTNQNDFKEITSLKYSTADTAFSSITDSDDPVILNIDELSKESNAPPYVKFWVAVGFKQLLCLALRVGGKPIGVIFFNIKKNEINNLNSSLLKGVCAQLSVAVSNILASEKLLNQLNEIKKYKQQLEEEKVYLKEEIESTHNHTEIIGEGQEIKKIFKLIGQVAMSDSTVLLQGETGTGKELIARAIHNNSSRKNKLMVKVNCAALPVNLIESELFGHERGSFTGAFERKIGKFELANNGTLFLDEVGDMPLDMQVKLLRALQEKEIERVGGKTTIKTDVRIIAATNRNLEKLIEEGKFRSDLYYRLNIFPITLPSLRNRRDDIPQLVSYFILRYGKKAGKKITNISNKALLELTQYDWPGNIRELEHLIERSVLLSTGDTIKEIHLPHSRKNLAIGLNEDDLSINTIDDNEKEYILKVLRRMNGRIGGLGGAAELLGVPTSTLNSKMKRLGIRKEHFG